MKRLIILALAAMVLSSPSMGQKDSKKKEKEASPAPLIMKTKIDTISFIIGSDIGRNLKSSNIVLTPEIFQKGFHAGQNGFDTIFSKEVSEALIQAFQQELMAQVEEDNSLKATENKLKARAFFDENRKKAGVNETASGLQYKILSPGLGESPKPTDEVTVHYKGTFLDGSVFDQSQPDNPITFGLSNVIPGWTEGLQFLKPGGKAILWIPADLGYGDRGVGPIPPGTALVFEVELISVTAK